MLAFFSFLIAIVMVLLLLSPFRELTGKQFNLHIDGALISTILSITFITGILAGSYPALYLSGFKPVLVLKGELRTSAGESWVRRGLVVFQFTLTLILVVSVFVVYRLMQLIQTKN